MKFTDEQCIEALKQNGGFVTRAAKAMGVSFQAVYKRINERSEVKEAYDGINEAYLDMAEWALISKIKDDKDLGSICFFLKSKGKARGYGDRQTLTVFDGQDRIDRDAQAKEKQQTMLKELEERRNAGEFD